jgi:hypothetical protein
MEKLPICLADFMALICHFAEVVAARTSALCQSPSELRPLLEEASLTAIMWTNAYYDACTKRRLKRVLQAWSRGLSLSRFARSHHTSLPRKCDDQELDEIASVVSGYSGFFSNLSGIYEAFMADRERAWEEQAWLEDALEAP